MKIVFFEIEDWEKEYFQKHLSGHELFFESGVVEQSVLEQYRDVDAICVFVYSALKASILAKFSNLKLILTRSTGFDHIDLSYCKEHRVTVCNVSTYGAHTVAEHTFALILALSRRLVPSIERTRRLDFTLEGLAGFDLYKKTLGILGLGHIGQKVVRIAKGFGMEVVSLSRHPSEEEAKRLGIHFLSLKELLGVSDIVSLHLPLTPQTRHIINKRNINWFKKGSFLINTARGPLVETEAVVNGLAKGILAGVGLDVLEEEIEIKEERELLFRKPPHLKNLQVQLLNHVLLTYDQALITPHNAFNSSEALKKILEVTVQNVENFLAGKKENVV